jgi:hypothetical protein
MMNVAPRKYANAQNADSSLIRVPTGQQDAQKKKAHKPLGLMGMPSG